MSTQYPNLEEIRTRVKKRTDEIRGRLGTGGTIRRQVGNGALVNQMMSRANTITARIQERKPGIIPMVKEFKPGERIKKVITPQTASPPNPPPRVIPRPFQRGKEMSVIV